ncbi:ATP synthase F1 subunit gamma [Effusibacillus dendaii]|uniref:ATP synthase gamma chain n=1 Tax=Effusibacillus dendaii TaxID=2743772 RepID=A0A7I8DCA7_9BACL|nr:ATP synthase F1 subunit gamma [Effusibacillus dendaii]BCJ87724.1 ATP synthase gamma chain [Effusibacillus dendaii]
MANIRDIRRRIRSVKNTQQITKAMKMVAAAKLRRAQERATMARPYAAKLEEVIGSIAKAGGARHPMLVKRPVKKIGYVVIGSDRGLAGSYNAQLVRHALNEFHNKSKDEYVIFAIGRKSRDFFVKRGYPVVGEITGLPDFPTFADIKRVTESVVKMYEEGTYDEVHLIYNKFNSAISQVPVTKQILPLEDVGGEAATATKANYLYEPSEEGVLDVLLPKYAETLIYTALLESRASFYGAQMTAMGNATDNASSMISSLTLALNRARQAAITTQITEIVGGAEALK